MGAKREQPVPKGYRWAADVMAEPWWPYGRAYMSMLCKTGYFDKFMKQGKKAVVRVGLLIPTARRDTRSIAIAVEAVEGLKRECHQFS